MPEQTHRHAAIMFTDIVGYKTLMGSDEDKAFEVLKKNQDIHNELIQQFKGKLIKEMGDGMLISFDLASDAVRCAIEIQKACKEQDIPLKIGVNSGEMVFAGADVLGDGVNIASRLQDNAQEGGIVISGKVYSDIKNKAGIYTKFIGDKKLKNVDEPVKVYEVLYQGEERLEIAKKESKKFSGKYLFYLGGIVIVIAAILIWNYLPISSKSAFIDKEKSIAVMPFDNESADKENEYFVNGMMEDIRNNLSKIGDLRVISKTSTEKYRETNLLTKEIAEELGVNYLLEGTVQKQGNLVKIHAQLIDTKTDDHIWTETYQRDISEVFKVQTEIAQSIANELYAVITPAELEIIETIPTTNLTAYDFFLRARDEHMMYWQDWGNMNALEQAITLYRRALEYDSTYAQAYTGLALAYRDNHFLETIQEDDFLDSVLILANKALSFDNQLDEAYFVRGSYYAIAKSEFEKALIDFEKALQINPNYSWAYLEKGRLYTLQYNNYVEGIKNYHMAASLDHSKALPSILRTLSGAYSAVGFDNKYIYYQKEALILDNDSAAYFRALGHIETSKDNFEVGLELYKKSHAYYLTQPFDLRQYWVILNLVRNNILLKNYEEAYDYSLKFIEVVDSVLVRISGSMPLIGYAFWQVGKQDEAKYYFNEQIRHSLENIRLNRMIFGSDHDVLAQVYSILGEKEKAYHYLDEFNKRSFFSSWDLNDVKRNSMFNSLRDEERFQQIMQSMEAKYQREHERVRVWLEEEGML